MKRLIRLAVLCSLGAAMLLGTTSCASKDSVEYNYKQRLKTDRAQQKADRRKARIQARQDRTDIWFESLLGL